MRGAADQAGLPMARLIAALVLVLSVVASHAKPLSPAEFTKEFSSALRAALPTAVVTVRSDLNLVIKNDDGTEAQAFLTNAYQDYPAGRTDSRASFANTSRRLPSSSDFARRRSTEQESFPSSRTAGGSRRPMRR